MPSDPLRITVYRIPVNGATKFFHGVNDGYLLLSNDVQKLLAPFNVLGTEILTTDVEILARTLYGEARNEGYTGMQAVANVVVNRAKAKKSFFGTGISGVCLKPRQFSCWNPKFGYSTKDANIVANYKRMISATTADPLYAQAVEIARLAVAGQLTDITKNAAYYHTTAINPSWAKGVLPVKVIGSHKFYTDAQIA